MILFVCTLEKYQQIWKDMERPLQMLRKIDGSLKTCVQCASYIKEASSFA